MKSHGEGDKSQIGFFFILAKIRKFFENCRECIPDVPCRSKIAKEIKAKLGFFLFWQKFENLLKIAESAFLMYPVGRKLRRNRSISHG